MMMRHAGSRLPPSSSSSLPWLPHHAASTAILSTEVTKLSPINNGRPSLSRPDFLHSHTNYWTLFRVLESCKSSSNLRTTLETHTKIIKLGYGEHQPLMSSLISIYVSCNDLNLARQLLNEVSLRELDLIPANMIIASSMRIREVDIAKKIFNGMPARDVVSWNSMIGGCVKNGRFQEALSIFRKMLSSNIEPDGYTFSSVINACARLGALHNAKWIHALMFERHIQINYILNSALIDMYSKCGSIETAKEIFRKTQENHVCVSNAMINGLAIHGLAEDAISLFSDMEVKNISPDFLTFVGILKACSHCGLVKQGREYFDLMRVRYSIQPQLEHYGAMVDMLGRAGCLEEAYAIIKEMPIEPDVVIWRSLLSACKTYKNIELGEIAVSKISNLKSGDYVLLSNIYCSTKKWDGAQKVREMMKNKRVRKNSGKSWIDLDGIVHRFASGDLSHPETETIYNELEGLIQRTKVEGYIHATELVMMDVSEEEKEENLNYHSEKLALAYGILKTGPGIEIRISKNLRICPDCHSWMEMVSKVLKRVIIVRDRIRFHRFENGLCTCGGHW